MTTQVIKMSIFLTLTWKELTHSRNTEVLRCFFPRHVCIGTELK